MFMVRNKLEFPIPFYEMPDQSVLAFVLRYLMVPLSCLRFKNTRQRGNHENKSSTMKKNSQPLRLRIGTIEVKRLRRNIIRSTSNLARVGRDIIQRTHDRLTLRGKFIPYAIRKRKQRHRE